MKNIFLSLVVSAVPAAASVSVVPATMVPGRLMPSVIAPSVLPTAQFNAVALPTLAPSVMPAASVAAPVVAPVAPAATAKETLVLSAEKIGTANNAEAAGTAMDASKKFFDNAAAANDGSAVAVNSPEQVDALNAVIAEALKPFNNATTKAKVIFHRAATNETRATDVSFDLDFLKMTPKGRTRLQLKDITYSYPDVPAAKPEFSGKLLGQLRLRNIMTQEQINSLAPMAEEMVKSYADKFFEKYGDAATVEAKVTHTNTNSKGDITGIGLVLGVKIDLAKLPSKVDPKSVLITESRLKVDIGLGGVVISGRAVSNPNAKEFERDQFGFKEVIDKLLAHDKKTISELVEFIRQIEKAAVYAANNRA